MTKKVVIYLIITLVVIAAILVGIYLAATNLIIFYLALGAVPIIGALIFVIHMTLHNRKAKPKRKPAKVPYAHLNKEEK
ncbi:MAG: hypothetical protein FWB71_02890 [Defluviitaleaceae bacterium]|nr:hypothetical protein [Defluviitaleaceae bacterium]